MILIADSGSTKTKWCLMTANQHSEEFVTDGINPLFQTQIAMKNSVTNQLLPQLGPRLWAGTLTHVFFYGAGCTPEKIPFVKDALQGVFKKAEIAVHSDTLGAARSLLGHSAGVACILGTGSASCYYNGEAIEWNVPSLGYILGDEGSGAVMGRRLVGDVLKNQLGEEVKELFLKEMNTTMADIIEHVYRQPFPNRYLASLSRFCSNHLDIPAVRALVHDCLEDFVCRNVLQYPAENEVGFVGSIAYYYRPLLEEVMAAHGRKLGRVIPDPIVGLKEYHAADCVPTM